MISCGTTSKEVGKKSSPCCCASASSSATRASNMGVLLRLQKGLQHLVEFVLVRDGHAEQAGMLDLFQRMLQGTDHIWRLAHPAVKAGIVFVADFTVSHHIALPQQILHQRFTDGVVVREIIAIGKVKEVNIPAARWVLLLEVLQSHLIGRRAACPTAVGEGEKVLLWHYLRLRVMGDEHRLDV